MAFLGIFIDRVKNITNDKKVLHERKRHTARRVASAGYALLSPDWGEGRPPASPDWGEGYSHPVLTGSTPSSSNGGTPIWLTRVQ